MAFTFRRGAGGRMTIWKKKTIDVSIADIEQLELISKRMRLSVGEIMRGAIKDYIKTQKWLYELEQNEKGGAQGDG